LARSCWLGIVGQGIRHSPIYKSLKELLAPYVSLGAKICGAITSQPNAGAGLGNRTNRFQALGMKTGEVLVMELMKGLGCTTERS
jgi:hypothetical protein